MADKTLLRIRPGDRATNAVWAACDPHLPAGTQAGRRFKGFRGIFLTFDQFLAGGLHRSNSGQSGNRDFRQADYKF